MFSVAQNYKKYGSETAGTSGVYYLLSVLGYFVCVSVCESSFLKFTKITKKQLVRDVITHVVCVCVQYMCV